MANMFCLVGRIEEIIKNEKSDIIVEIKVNRNYKNKNGEYDTDIIEVLLQNIIGTKTREYCNKGDIIGIKGRIEIENNKTILIAEKVSFLKQGNNE